MKIKWQMSIGYQSKQTGTVNIDAEELVGMSEDQIEEYIDGVVWEDAVQHVDTSWDIVEE